MSYHIAMGVGQNAEGMAGLSLMTNKTVQSRRYKARNNMSQ
ncbi:hypothetical protein [Salinimonas marina]|nr:hypothetical protein [Salinimonas marina]